MSQESLSPRAQEEINAMVDAIEGPQQEENIDFNAAFDEAMRQTAPVAEQKGKTKKRKEATDKKQKTVRKRQKKDAPAPAAKVVAEPPPPPPKVVADANLEPPEAPALGPKRKAKRIPKHYEEEEPIDFPDIFVPRWSPDEIIQRHAQMGNEEQYYGPLMGLWSPGMGSVEPPSAWQTRITDLDVENNPDVLSVAIPQVASGPVESPFPIEMSLNFNNADGSIDANDAKTFRMVCEQIYALSRPSKGKIGDHTVEYMSVSDRRSLGGRHDKTAKDHKFREPKQEKNKVGRGLSYEQRKNFLIATFQIEKFAERGYVMNENEIKRMMRQTKIRPFDPTDILLRIARPDGSDWDKRKADSVSRWKLLKKYRTLNVSFSANDTSVDESNILMWADFLSGSMKQFPDGDRDFELHAQSLFVRGMFVNNGTPLTFAVQYYTSGHLQLKLGYREGAREKDMSIADIERADPRAYVQTFANWFLNTFFPRRPSYVDELRDLLVSMNGRLRHPTHVALLEGSEGSKRRAIIEQLTQVTKYTVSGIMPLVRFEPLASLKKRVDVAASDDLISDDAYKLLEQYHVDADADAKGYAQYVPKRVRDLIAKIQERPWELDYKIAEAAQGGRLRAPNEIAQRVYGADGQYTYVRAKTPSPEEPEREEQGSPASVASTSSDLSDDALERVAERQKVRDRIGTIMDNLGKPTAAVSEAGYIKSHMDRFVLIVDPKKDPSGLFEYASLVASGPTEFKLVQAKVKSQPETPFAKLAVKVRDALKTSADKSHNVSIKVKASDATFVFYDAGSGAKVAEVVVPTEEYPGVFNESIRVSYWWRTGTMMIRNASYKTYDQGPWKALSLAWRILALIFKRAVANLPPIIESTKEAGPQEKTRKRGFERYGTTLDRRGRKNGTTCQPKSRQVNPNDPLDWTENRCEGQNMIVLPNNEGFPCCFEMPKNITAAYKKDVQKKYQEIGMDMPDHVLAALGLASHPPPIEGVERKKPLKIGFNANGEVTIGNRQVVRMPIDVIKDVALDNRIPDTRADVKETPYHKNHIAAFFAWKEIYEGRLPKGKSVPFYERVAKYLPRGAGYVEPSEKTPDAMHAAIEKTSDILKKAIQVAIMGAGDVKWIEGNNPIPFAAQFDMLSPTASPRRPRTAEWEAAEGAASPQAVQEQEQAVQQEQEQEQEQDQKQKQAKKYNNTNNRRKLSLRWLVTEELEKRIAEGYSYDEIKNKIEEMLAHESVDRQQKIEQYLRWVKATRNRIARERTTRQLNRAAGEGTSGASPDRLMQARLEAQLLPRQLNLLQGGGARPDAIEELFGNDTGVLEWIDG